MRGSVRLTLPDQGDYPVTIKSGVGDVRINVPSGMDARITASTGLLLLDEPAVLIKFTNRPVFVCIAAMKPVFDSC